MALKRQWSGVQIRGFLLFLRESVAYIQRRGSFQSRPALPIRSTANMLSAPTSLSLKYYKPLKFQ
jgi:hypothetical protein